MTTETLLAISAGATFLLALAAFWAIWQNYNFRKEEKKERLLKEITDWVLEIWKCGLELGRPTEFAGTPQGYASLLDRESEIKNTFKELLRRSHYIKEIILPAWNDLYIDVENMRQQLSKHIKVIDMYKVDPLDKRRERGISNHRTRINTLAYGIVQRATGIRKKGIDK